MVSHLSPIAVLVVAHARREPALREMIAGLSRPLPAATRFETNERPTATIVADARAAAPSRGVVVVVEREEEVETHLAQGADEVLVEPFESSELERAVRRAALRASVRDDHAIEARTLERVLAGLACAVESPLASLALDLDGLRSGSLETLDDFDGALDDCAKAAEQVGELLRDAAVLARVDETDARVNLAVDVLLSQVLHALGGGLALQAHVEVHADDDLPPIVAPMRRLARTLASVIIQALDATPSEPPPAMRRLRIAVRGLPDAVALSFDVRPAIDAPPASTRLALADEGRLAVMRAALRSFDGELFSERSSDGGLRMVVFLPRPHTVPAVQSLDLRPSRPAAARRRARVLVVDRDARVLRAISRALSDRYDVLVAISAEEALGLARELSVDVAVLDSRLPDQTTSSLIDELVRIDPMLQNRVVLLGSSSDDSTQGAPVLKKPLRRNALLTTIESRLRSVGPPGARVLN